MLRFCWRGAPLPIPYPATRRSWSWDGKAMKQLSEERTGLSVWWKEAGWRRLTRLEFWNPKVKGAECLNRQPARSILPLANLRTRMVMAGHSKAEVVSAIKAAFDNKQ